VNQAEENQAREVYTYLVQLRGAVLDGVAMTREDQERVVDMALLLINAAATGPMGRAWERMHQPVREWL
jgi:hypothetical protein